MSTAILRSEDVLKSRFHLHAFGYRPPLRQPPMKTHRRKTPPPRRPAAAAAAATSPPPHKPNRIGPARSSRSLPKPDRPTPARTGRKPRPAAGAGKDNDGGAADQLRHHRQRLVMEEVTILKRGEAMKPSAPALQATNETMRPSAPVLPGSNGGDDPYVSSTVPIDHNSKKLGFPGVDLVYAGPGFSVSSPEPSSVPHPGFLLRPLAASEEATRSLLRLLRLHQIAP